MQGAMSAVWRATQTRSNAAVRPYAPRKWDIYSRKSPKSPESAMIHTEQNDDMRVISDPKDFDGSSGNRLERLVFNNRLLFMLACVFVTVFLGFQATKLKVNA